MKSHFGVLIIIMTLLSLSACGNTPPAVAIPTVTGTTDPCSADALPGEVDKVHKLMREFDDASLLGTNTPRDQLPPVISDMQRIRRAAEDQILPSCLAVIKQLQLAHMNTVISTLVAFLSGADQNALNQGADLARKQHNEYALEYARLLGLTVVVPPTSTLGVVAADTATPTPPVMSALNPGPASINLYSEPSADSTVIAVLFVNETARVVAQSDDGQWVQVVIPDQPGQLGWLQASMVTISQIP